MTGRREAYRGQRVLDLLIAIPGLVLFAPIIAAAAALVRIRLGRPAFFRQERAGKGGEPFTITKVRTMLDMDLAGGGPLHDERRITPLGSLLRSMSIDELPELWNVVRGEMSVVGPRPLLLRYTDRYSPDQARRLEVRPGLTGLAQVSGRNDTDWERRLALDVWYVDHASLALDLRILGRTVGVVLRKAGISAPGHVSMPEFAPPDRRKVRP